jgi:hypothetical protein
MIVGVYGVNQGVWNGSYVDRHGLAEQQAVLLQYQQDNLQHFRKEARVILALLMGGKKFKL